MKHHLGLTVFSILAAASIALAGCGSAGQGIGLLEPFPTASGNPGGGGTATPTPTPTPTPAPTREPLSWAIEGQSNMVNMVSIDSDIFVLTGFTPNGTQRIDEESRGLVFYKEGTDKGTYLKDDVAYPMPVKLNITDQDGQDVVFETPMGLSGKYFTNNTPTREDDWGIICVTDPSQNKVYSIKVVRDKKDSFNWSSDAQATELTHLIEGGNTSTRPFMCSVSQSYLMWNDSSPDNGRIYGYAFKDQTIKPKLIMQALQSPGDLDCTGPCVAVTEQNLNRVVLFNPSDDSSSQVLTPGGQNTLLVQAPTTSTMQMIHPWQPRWVNNYLVVSCGYGLPYYTQVTPGEKDGSMWAYKFNSLPSGGSTTEYSTLLESGLNCPVNQCFTYDATEDPTHNRFDYAFIQSVGPTSVSDACTLEYRAVSVADPKEPKLIGRAKDGLCKGNLSKVYGMLAIPPENYLSPDNSGKYVEPSDKVLVHYATGYTSGAQKGTVWQYECPNKYK